MMMMSLGSDVNEPAAATGTKDFLQYYNTDHDFIHSLRKKLINGEETDLTNSVEKQFYFKEKPWEIFNEGTDRELYFFTEKPVITAGKKTIENAGKWRIMRSVAIKDFKSEIIGFKKTRAFVVPEMYASDASIRMLIIHEYSLYHTDDRNSLVLCKIRQPVCSTPSLWARQLQSAPKRHAEYDMDIEDQGSKSSKAGEGGRMTLSRRGHLLRNMTTDRGTTLASCALEAWKPF